MENTLDPFHGFIEAPFLDVHQYDLSFFLSLTSMQNTTYFLKVLDNHVLESISCIGKEALEVVTLWSSSNSATDAKPSFKELIDGMRRNETRAFTVLRYLDIRELDESNLRSSD